MKPQNKEREEPVNIKLFFKKHFTIPTYPYPCSDIMKQRYDIMVSNAKNEVSYALAHGSYQITFLKNQAYESYLVANRHLLTVKNFEHFEKYYDKLIESLLRLVFLKQRVKIDINDPNMLLHDALVSRSSMTDGMIVQCYQTSVEEKKTEKGRANGFDYFTRTMERYLDAMSLDNINTINSLCGIQFFDASSMKWLDHAEQPKPNKSHIFTILVIALIVLIIACSGNSDDSNSNNASSNTTSDSVSTNEVISESLSAVDRFIDSFNQISDIPITELSDIDVTDKDSAHYRVEFRLHAFKDSVSKTGICGVSLVDIVTYGKEYQNIRVIAKDNNVENLAKIMKSCIMVLSPETPESKIDEICALFVSKKDASLLHLDDIKFTSHGKYNDSMDLCIIYE